MKVNRSTDSGTKVSELGVRLLEARARRGLSAEDAAALFGISRVMLGKYERGEATPGGEVLAQMLAEGFDVLYLLSGRTLAEHAGELTADERFCLRFFRDTDEDGRRALKRAAREEALRAGFGTALPGTVLARVVMPQQASLSETDHDLETARMKPKEKAANLAAKTGAKR